MEFYGNLTELWLWKFLISHNIGLLTLRFNFFSISSGEGAAKDMFRNDSNKAGGHRAATSPEKRSLAKQSYYARGDL